MNWQGESPINGPIVFSSSETFLDVIELRIQCAGANPPILHGLGTILPSENANRALSDPEHVRLNSFTFPTAIARPTK
jgi:hypothetical protein